MEEKKLITLIHQGHQEAFGELYEMYSEKIYRYIYFRLLHKQSAEDLTSQVFVKALQSMPLFNSSRGAFSAWIYRIARNTLFDFLRTEKKHIDLFETEKEADTNLPEELDRRELLKKAKEYLVELTDEQRDIILMRVWDEMSFKEIAEVLGKKEGAVTMAFSRATTKIKKEVLVMLLIIGITQLS